jgi:hypothetical protein
VRIWFEFVALAGIQLGAWSVVGFPVKAWLLDGDDRPSPVPAPVLGLAVWQVASWYWYDQGGDGSAGWTRTLVALGVVASALSLPRWWRRPYADRTRSIIVNAACAALVLACFTVGYRGLFTQGFHTPVTVGNADIVSYVIHAEHLVTDGFDDPGWIHLVDLGVSSRRLGFGSYTILAGAGGLTGTEVYKVAMPTMFALVVVGAWGLLALMRALVRGHDALLVVAIAVVISTPLFNYVVGNYFVGQVMAMAVVPYLAVACLRAADPAVNRAGLLRAAGGSAVVLLVMLSNYAHMAVTAPAIIIPGVLLTARRQEVIGAFRRAASVGVGGAVVAAVLVPQWVKLGIDNTKEFGDVEAGWRLPGFVPTELVGFVRTAVPRPDTDRVVASVLLALVVVVAAWSLRRTQPVLARYAIATTALVLVSHWAVYLREGDPTYRQWKWITFFQPLFALLVVVVVFTAVVQLVRAPVASLRFGRHVLAVPATAAAVALLVPLLYIAVRNTDVLTNHSLRRPSPPLVLSADDIELQRAPALADVEAVGVATPSWITTMWSAYFLRDHDVHIRTNSYFPPSNEPPPETVEFAGNPVTGDGVAQLSASYRLRRTTPARAGDELGGEVAVRIPERLEIGPGTDVAGVVEVTNTGTTAWVLDGAQHGVVRLGVHLMTVDGRQISYDHGRFEIAPGSLDPLLPGQSAEIPVTVSIPGSGSYEVVFELVSELVAWFGDPATVTVIVG